MHTLHYSSHVNHLRHPAFRLGQVEAAVQFGQPVLLVDVMEELDPALEPLLGKSYIR